MPSADKFEWPQGNPLFEVQWRAVTESLAGNGTLNPGDFEVEATLNDLEIDVAAGEIFYLGSTYSTNNAVQLTLDGGHPNYDRWDTVYFDTDTESVGVHKGTAEQYPEPPGVSGDEHLLAIIYVPEGATDVPDTNVLNWRASLSNTASDIKYNDTSGEFNASNLQEALDDLSEAVQISEYPLSQNDMEEPLSEISGYPIPQDDLEGPPSELSDYPLPLDTDTDLDVGDEDFTANEGGITIYDNDNEHVPRPQVDDKKKTKKVRSQLYQTNDEEVVLVDTSFIGSDTTIILNDEDARRGNTIAVVDFSGEASNNPITINTAGSETIDGESSKTIDSDYYGFIFTTDGSNWTTLSSVYDGISVQSGGSPLLNAVGNLNFDTGLSVTQDGAESVRVEADISSRVSYSQGVFTHTGGSSTTHTIEGVTTDETINLNVEVGVDSDPSFAATYAFDYSWGYSWDDNDGEMDIVIEATWDSDPGAGNDVDLDFDVFETDGSKPSGVVVEQDGSPVVVPATAIDFGSGLDVTDQSDGTVRVDSTLSIPMIKATTNANSTNINQTIRFPWNVEVFADSPYDFDTSANSITVQEDGTYEVHSNIAQDTSGSERLNPVSQLYVNGNKQNAAGKSGYERHNSGHDEASTHFSWVGELSSGDTITVEMRQGGGGGSVNPQINECNLFVKKLPRP